jgi:hypothetical protein
LSVELFTFALLLRELARGQVAAAVAGEHERDGGLVASSDGAAQLGPAVDVPGEGRHELVELVVGESPVVLDVGVSDGELEAAANGAHERANDGLVDRRGLDELGLELVDEFLTGLGLDLRRHRCADCEISDGHAPAPGSRRGRRGGRSPSTGSPASSATAQV